MESKQKIYDRNRKNSEALNFRVDKRMYKEISLIAEQKGISRAEVCRERLKGLQYEPPLLSDLDTKELIKALNLLGNNLNQATKSLNAVVIHFHKKETATNSSTDLFSNKKYQLFENEQANKIAQVFMKTDPDKIFTEANLHNIRSAQLNDEEKKYMKYWIEKNERPQTKAEYATYIHNRLSKALASIQKMEEQGEKLWELV